MTTTTRHGARAVPQMEVAGLSLRPRRRLSLVALVSALVVVACAGLAAGISLLQTPVYGAQVELLLKPRPDVSDAAVERAMLTEEVVLTSPAVLGPVAAAEAEMSVEDLRRATTTSMLGRSNVLRVTVGDPDPERALALVQAIERQYAELHASDPLVDPSAPGRPTITPSTLNPARPAEEPLAPRPLQAAAGGTLVGLLLATGVATVLLRPVIGGRRIRP